MSWPDGDITNSIPRNAVYTCSCTYSLDMPELNTSLSASNLLRRFLHGLAIQTSLKPLQPTTDHIHISQVLQNKPDSYAHCPSLQKKRNMLISAIATSWGKSKQIRPPLLTKVTLSPPPSVRNQRLATQKCWFGRIKLALEITKNLIKNKKTVQNWYCSTVFSNIRPKGNRVLGVVFGVVWSSLMPVSRTISFLEIPERIYEPRSRENALHTLQNAPRFIRNHLQNV